MKKFSLCLFFLISLFLPLAAQEVISVDDEQTEEVNEQYETFSWEPVPKAKQYGVTIEKYDQVNEIWVDYKDVKLKETELEVLFKPGTYRVSICTYNLIGRKGKASDWVTFKILEEHVPYLNEKFLPKNKIWNAPVLVLGNTEAEDIITSPENYASNTILIKGRNIFSPRTEFYLIPKDEPSDDAVPFVNYTDERKEQKLNVIQRNSKEFSVVVSYKKEQLASGYYSLEVRNPGDNRDAVDILVLNNDPIQITADKGFYVDKRYNVNCIDASGFGSNEISITGTGLNSSQQYYLEPSLGVFAYPFETQVERNTVPLEQVSFEKLGDKNVKVNLNVDASLLRTGYYNLVARNWDGSSVKFVCLVKKAFGNEYVNSIKKIKSKYNKRSGLVDITITGTELSSQKKYTLVSEYVSEIDSNTRTEIPLSFINKKLTAKMTPGDLAIGKYALLIEDSFSSEIIYCNLDSSLKLSRVKMSDSVVEKTFLRPEGKEEEVTLNADDTASVVFVDNKIAMNKRYPPLFTTMKLDLSFQKKEKVVMDLELDLLNFQFAALSAGFEYVNQYSNISFAGFSLLRFEYPNEYVSPYIAVGAGSIFAFNDFVNTFTDDNVYAVAQFGVNVLTIFDVKYNLYLNNFTTTPYFTEGISFGISFPLRSYKFKRKVLTHSAVITKTGEINGISLLDQKNDVDKVELLEASVVGGFAEYNQIENIVIDVSVEVIEENAFKDCTNLNTVNFASKRSFNHKEDVELPLTIKKGAFANDTQIDSIRIPARTVSIEAGAFAGWTNGQIIILEWNENEGPMRDVTGLMDTAATVIYLDQKVFRGNYKNPFENQENWVPLNSLSMQNVSVYKDSTYELGVKLQGIGLPWYRTDLDTWINQDSPKELIDYIKSGDTIRFQVQGDGNSYDLVFVTDGGGYFHYKFKTKKDRVMTIEIPYKKIQKFGYSSKKKLDIENLKMCTIIPMCRNEWNDSTFFEFEVINND